MSKFNDAFWKWFGDSKVVDSKGNPLVVYHGTDTKIDEFKKEKRGGAPDSREAFFFTDSKKAAAVFAKAKDEHGGAIIPVYLRIENPLIVDDKSKRKIISMIGDRQDNVSKSILYLVRDDRMVLSSSTVRQTGLLLQIARENGYDGLIIPFACGDELSGTLSFYKEVCGAIAFCVFEPTQIKSAIGNDGTYDVDDPDIRSNPEYSGEHQAPMKDDGAPLWNVTLNGIYPKDFYSTMDQYAHYGDARDYAALDVISTKKDHPNSPVYAYRAIPKGVKSGKLNVGDWVTTVRAYAKEHGEDNLNGDYKIISEKVHARDLFTDGNSIFEWGYDPQPVDVKALLETKIKQWRKLKISEDDIAMMVEQFIIRNGIDFEEEEV